MQARERGITLLEVLLTMTVLALGLFAAAAQQLRGLQISDEARRDSQAVYLAQGLLERGRAVGVLPEDERADWQGRIRRLLGASAQGRATGAGETWSLEIHRSGQALISLRGRVSP
ncbi:prepilin-type N-terminal cleavage/methylation domain-containing protein [Pseudomonas guariconensis]|uniref:Uncharacterized protein n=1 Tax=Pseudomonas putida TaxID=303 RepID=A0A6S5TF49_PSEPU|nr:prepilin-type N-terminal cleavage/methylation domain-containing protein [Pseudomonas guariconensis]URK97329.1 prepilin-type N-terminal cleavage/methylation domain-containing protein [Pseudomonas sp. BYT-1]BBR52350.1 hypothetical protein WP4W18C03_06770 [Pseudomonas putida]BBT41991.1 hypothetical protein WP8W18C01_43320 [Pseudomonas putida]